MPLYVEHLYILGGIHGLYLEVLLQQVEVIVLFSDLLTIVLDALEVVADRSEDRIDLLDCLQNQSKFIDCHGLPII